MVKDLIVKLNTRIEEANAAYAEGSPLLEDEEYDALKVELQALVNTPEGQKFSDYAPTLTQLWHSSTNQKRFPHAVPMLSIENFYSKEALLAWYSERAALIGDQNLEFVVEPKFDGISVDLQYRDGVLIKALTRGTGSEGEDITSQVSATTIPFLIDGAKLPSVVHIRGELVMKEDVFKKLNNEAEAKEEKVYLSSRNLTAGTMKTKPTKAGLALISSRKIQIAPWQLLSSTPMPNYPTHKSRMALLEELGFPPFYGLVGCGVKELETLLESMLRFREETLGPKHHYASDGVVIKVNSVAVQEQLGIKRTTTNYQVCFKPQTSEGTTYIRRVDWQVGRQGKLTPVAICDPVILAGAKIERATLNNLTWIHNLGLTLNAKVAILRSGEVIPVITRVLERTNDPIEEPRYCLCCKGLVEIKAESGVETHWCTNSACPERLREYLTFVGGRNILEIDSLGPEMATSLVCVGVKDLADLFDFRSNVAQRLEIQHSAVAVNKMVESLEKAKTANWDCWLAALGIPRVSKTLGKQIATKLCLQPGDISTLPNKLANLPAIEGIGTIKTETIKAWANDSKNLNLCSRLAAANVQPTAIASPKLNGAPLNGVVFCITGEFGKSRERIIEDLQALGAVNKSGVSSKCTMLIVGTEPGATKLNKAKAYNVPLKDEVWLKEVLGKNGLSL